jgi:hypothetical protein
MLTGLDVYELSLYVIHIFHIFLSLQDGDLVRLDIFKVGIRIDSSVRSVATDMLQHCCVYDLQYIAFSLQK